MTARDGFDRLVRTWLVEEGAPVSADYLDEVLARTATVRQRPVWQSPRRWLPMQLTMTTRLIRVPAPVRYAVVAVLLIGLLVAVAILSGVGSRNVPAPFGPAANGRLGFFSNGSIVLTNADGSNRAVAKFAENVLSGPTFSRDGTRIAFYGDDPSSASGALYVANADGSAAVQVSGDLPITIDPRASPTWSPSGDRLVFPATISGIQQLVVARADGTGSAILARSTIEEHTFPSWSPDGQWIAFAIYPTDGTPPRLALIHPDDTGARTVFTAGAGVKAVQDLEWAPDASGRLLFGAGGDTENRLLVVDADVVGATPTAIVDRPGIIEFGAAWSPDARRIAANQSEVGSIVVDADGSNLRVLPDARCAGRILWSPDGTHITCLDSVGLGNGTYQLLVVDVDGTGPVQRLAFEGSDSSESGATFSWQRLAK